MRKIVFQIMLSSFMLLLLRTRVRGTNNSSVPSNQLRKCGDKRCDCTFLPNGYWNATCHLNGSFLPPTPFILFETLDLSKNDLLSVPKMFLWNQRQLTNLSLAHNSISIIKDCDFGTLPNLKFLDFSFNPLKRWEGGVKDRLPNLLELFVTGTVWIPRENILETPSLDIIHGVTWSKDCSNCDLYNLVKRNYSHPYTPGLEGKEQAEEFAQFGFYPYFCNNRSSEAHWKCSLQKIIDPDRKGKERVAGIPQKLFYSSFVLGAVAMLLNLIVLLTVFSARSLRNSTSMLLIANMAFCDLLMGVYSVIIGDLNIFNMLPDMIANPGKKFVFEREGLCKFSTAIFTSAQCVAAATSLLLTVEKFYSIVYCMNPNRRLSRKAAFASIVSFWILSLLYGLSPLFEVLNLSVTVTMMCSFPVAREENTFLICPSILTALYLINIPLYVAIFISVRRSGDNVGIKREAAIFKKIALLVTTNFLLLLIPLILIITLVPAKNIHKRIELDTDSNTQLLFIFGFWFPFACLGFNSCINPILCAFRQERFVKQIRRVLGSLQVNLRASFVNSQLSERTQSASQINTASSQVVLYRMTSYSK
ncbi:neuropeptide receptor 22-like [Montipora foliosa]|uniref:neuropeptide receptor 22-like n=1 Tax=Montipora foliosa TaxID=591990 RepID=UPI0035F141EC